MNRRDFLKLAGLGAAAGALPALARAADAETAAPRQPNFLVIVADDMGFSDAGCYGGEIATPNLDRLAANGIRFTQCYSTARCWPSRACILTGYYAQQVRRDTVPGVPSGARGLRPAWARLLPERLKPLGYRSYHSGKWHIDGKPLQGGFDRSYWLEDTDRYFSPKAHLEDDTPLPAVAPDSDYYATSAIADRAIRYLKEHADKHADQPFFQYLAFTAPHFPLHALAQDVARYRDRYREGWDVVREQRWKRLREMGIVNCALSPLDPSLTPRYFKPQVMETLGPGEVKHAVPWKDLTEEQKRFQAAKMAVHAAMVDRMDREIGRVLDQVRAMGAWENTVVIFVSDNGADATLMVRGDGHDRAADAGSARSFLCLGPGWASASNAPFRRHKVWVHEGGISSPLIVHWPAGIAARGEWRHDVIHFIDLPLTLLELAGGRWPQARDGNPVPPPPGRSLVRAFAKDGTVEREFLFFSHEGNRAIRTGNWKLVSDQEDNNVWELYDLSTDRCERVNLADKHPEKVRELTDRWTRAAEEFRLLAAEDAATRPSPRSQGRP
ncbi:MAG: arylsulfatase [Acidobacteria bacterium]|nr:arylsulfatase [Planctomycetota bacterium]MBE3134566.1 arylsulfatase [Acidobacteriota bacterium]